MENKNQRISACLVVYNEEKVIEKCLDSIKGFVDEIILVHDGECTDKTLEIAEKYTDKIFVREHVGVMEAHLVFAFEQTKSEWLFRIDADEFLSPEDFPKIKQITETEGVNGLILNWEMWDGKNVISFVGLQKMCLVRRNSFHYCGIPHENGMVDGLVKKIDVFLHHRPAYSNISWSTFMRKSKKWVPVHTKYFFPELVKYECFNTTPDKWITYTGKVRKHPIFHLICYPLSIFFGQLKNGLWASRIGWNLALQSYVYYLFLYFQVWHLQRKLNYR